MRRGYKTFTTLRAALIACALYAGLLALMGGGMFSAAGVAMFALTVSPLYLLIAAFTAGFLPMFACAGMTLAALFVTGQAEGLRLAAYGALYLLPMAAAAAYCMTRQVPFWRTCGLIAALLAISQMCICLMLQLKSGGRLYLAAGSLAAAAVNAQPYRDGLLYTLISYGLLNVPAAMQDTAIVAVEGGYAFSAEAVNELLLQMRSYVSQAMRALVPALLVSGSALNALMGVSLGVRYGRRAAQRRAFKRGEKEQFLPDLGMPPLRAWYIPRPWGLRIGLLAIGYPLARLASGDALYLLGSLMWQAFSLCFAVQGLASVNAAQHRRGTGRGWRTAVVAAAFIFRFMQTVLIIAGVVDQFSNVRGLRPPLRPRNEEE